MSTIRIDTYNGRKTNIRVDDYLISKGVTSFEISQKAGENAILKISADLKDFEVIPYENKEKNIVPIVVTGTDGTCVTNIIDDTVVGKTRVE